MSADIEIVSVLGANGQPLPLHGNSIGSNWNTNVKQERVEDPEILEMAAKLKEAQRDALAKQQMQAAHLANRQAMVNGVHNNVGLVANNGQTNILNYLQRQRPVTSNNNNNVQNASNTNSPVVTNGRSTNNEDNSKKPPIDEESQRGRFGWTTFGGKTYIPFIFRQQEKYCSVRMVENKLLNKYLHCLHSDIYSSCTCVRSYYITQAEANLLHDINSKHCDFEFTKEPFSQKDLIVRLSDATKFYQFLDICYRKLISGSKSPSEKCGFIRINKESVVPYTVRNGEQVVPLFYFEGETENLKQKADLLSGWDLAYLKFCCKVQGIRNELFSSENVAVISLTDIKSYFPNGTEFEDYWPSKVVDSNLLIGNRSNGNNTVNWTRQPSQPPPKVMPPNGLAQKQQHSTANAAAAAAAAAHQQSLLKRGQSAAAAAAAVGAFNAQTALMQQPNAAAAAAAQRLHSNAALAQATVQALTNGSWMPQPQNNLPLLHAQMLASQAQQTHAANTRNQYHRTPMESILLNNRQPYATYNNTAISMQPVNSHGQGNAPPPLVRSATGPNANHMSNAEQSLLQQQQQQQQQHHQYTHHNHQHHQQHHHHPHHNQQQSQQLQIQQQRQQLRQNVQVSQLHQQQKHSTAFYNNNNNNNNNNNSQSLNANCSTNSPKSHTTAHGGGGGGNGSGGGSGNSVNNCNSPSALLGGNFNLVSSTPSTLQDYNNLALWNQLTPNQRLLITQQFKSMGNFLGTTNTKNSYPPPPIPSLPLDTDLITMLDYNSNKSKVANDQISNTDVVNSSLAKNGQFTQPHIPSAMSAANSTEMSHSRRNIRTHFASTPNAGQTATTTTTMPLNSSAVLEDFEKKFKMNEEMRAVVQKVLSNPDLSTFIQTNSSNTFVPFISPPISPASSTNHLNTTSNNVTSLTLISNPQVTITPQLPNHLLRGNTTSYLPTNTTAVSTSSAVIGSNRQKSVICTNPLTLLPSPNSNSSASHSPSPNRTNKSTYAQNHIQRHSSPSAGSIVTTPTEVIDLSSPRRSLQAATAYLQQQQQQQAAAVAAAQQQQQQHHQQQQQRMAAAAAAAAHHSQQNGRGAGVNGLNNAANNNSASMHLQRHAALAAAAAAAAASPANDNPQRLSIIPEISANNMNDQPYKVQKVFVESHLVSCINMKAYNHTEQLMTLTDFQKYFFPTIPLDQCKCLIETLGVELYRGNRRQLQVLMEHDRNHNENIPLIQVRDIIKYMTQLTFMIRNQEQPPSKRLRMS